MVTPKNSVHITRRPPSNPSLLQWFPLNIPMHDFDINRAFPILVIPARCLANRIEQELKTILKVLIQKHGSVRVIVRQPSERCFKSFHIVFVVDHTADAEDGGKELRYRGAGAEFERGEGAGVEDAQDGAAELVGGQGGLGRHVGYCGSFW